LALYESNLPLQLLSRGKVRDIYDTPNGLLLVATDRLSAFDVVFGDPIPHKGEVLNQLSAYWFGETLDIVPNHLISARPELMLGLDEESNRQLHGRSSLCHKVEPLSVECVVRGYLEGSAWKDYQQEGAVCGIRLPKGLTRRSRLPHPIFTPTTKATEGHDLPITFEQVVDTIGVEAAEFVRRTSIELYSFAHERLLSKGILISDTKFEFGRADDGKIILIDEALTPDSSRFWEADGYTSGGDSRSLDKQYVRDYVESIGWEKKPPAPRLPEDVVSNTTRLYVEIYEKISGQALVTREDL
jgi:phosphoribosylaminoimidazole-succinocarboxamide synthase